MALTKVPSNLDAAVSTTQSASDNSTNVATTAYVTTAIANLSDSAPAALNTLNEIAAALGDDANYASTTTAAIAAKLPLAGGTLTGNLTGTQAFFSPNTAGKNTITITTNASDDGRILIKSDTTDKVDIQANGSSYFNGGNVGIGTTSPASKLTLSDTSSNSVVQARFINDARNYALGVHGGLSDSFVLYDETASAARLVVDSSGTVLIGNTGGSFHSSVLPLIVGSGSGDEGMAIYSGSSNKGKIGFADAATDDSGSYRGYFQYDHSDDSLRIGTAGSERMRLDSSGNLAFGDDQHLYLGDATSDLDIYHIGGSVSVLRSTPALVIQSDDYISLGTYSDGELMLKATKNGAVDLYHDNVAKLSTKTTGVQVAGIIGVNVTANAGHSNSSGSIQIKGSNDNYQPTNFNEAAMLSLDATNSEGRYAAIRFTHGGGTEGLFGLVRATATSDITDYVWQMYDGSANAYKELFRISEQGYPQFPVMGGGSGQNAVQWWSGGGRAGGMLIQVSSSQRFKKDIIDCTIDSSKIYNLQAKSFKWNEKSVMEDKEDWGMIAEEVIEHIPELGTYKDGVVESIQYEKLSVLLLEEIKKLNERIKVLEG